MLVLSACEPISNAEPLPLTSGYRDPADQCVRVGKNDFTNQFLDDNADLVGCPEGLEEIGLFFIETAAVQVAVAQGFVSHSVPLG